MERIKLGTIADGTYAVFAIRDGFDYTFEIDGEEGYEEHYSTLEDLMEDVFIFSHGIGFHTLKAIVKAFLNGEEPELTDDEREALS